MLRNLVLAATLAGCQWTILTGAFSAIPVHPQLQRLNLPSKATITSGGTNCYHYLHTSQTTTCLFAEKESPKSPKQVAIENDEMFDAKTTLSLVGGQSVLIGVAAVAAYFIGTPNYGLGPNIDFSAASIQQGAVMALPLAVFAYVLDLFEESIPALQDVTTATQRSVLALLGGTFKPVFGVATATALGVAAGLGEEMLFRGVLQYELGIRFGEVVAVAVASVVFGLLHAVTPVYALLASVASVYFGWLYLDSGNLAVPIAAHGIYDIGALVYAHWTVANLTQEEKIALVDWSGPSDRE
jgi:membrane protease YdiL (CAAX protease family)